MISLFQIPLPIQIPYNPPLYLTLPGTLPAKRILQIQFRAVLLLHPREIRKKAIFQPKPRKTENRAARRPGIQYPRPKVQRLPKTAKTRHFKKDTRPVPALQKLQFETCRSAYWRLHALLRVFGVFHEL